ncbi:MAG TPA: tripartite tricarboxylate transporter substrate binding protein [Burkholderiales bacterium]|nr:tripartite tricarboxylate transporter substrate binding protein [Burkholderiales bacterium]
MNRTSTAVVLALALSGTAIETQAQAYPTKPIRMLVGFTAGSEIDVIGRVVFQDLSERIGQKIVIDNRSGAGGTVAGALAATAPADGYTLFLNSVAHAASSALYPGLPYDPLRDFAAVSQVTSAPNVLVVAPSQGLKSIKELIALARQKPGYLNAGHAGAGSGTHITGEMFRTALKIDVSPTPYKGTPELLADTMTGRIHYSFSPIGSTLSFLKDKRLVGLAVTTLARTPLLPDVPTVSESAIAGFEWDQWYGLFAPAKTSRAIVDRLSRELAVLLALPEVKERVILRGSVTKPSSPEQFEQFVRAETAKIGKAIKDGGIRLD